MENSSSNWPNLAGARHGEQDPNSKPGAFQGSRSLSKAKLAMPRMNLVGAGESMRRNSGPRKSNFLSNSEATFSFAVAKNTCRSPRSVIWRRFAPPARNNSTRHCWRPMSSSASLEGYGETRQRLSAAFGSAVSWFSLIFRHRRIASARHARFLGAELKPTRCIER